MYKKILVPLENAWADPVILAHIRLLVDLTKAEILIVHVADGWAARNYQALDLSESEEIKTDRIYLEEQVRLLRQDGFNASYLLAFGEPPKEIIRIAQEQAVDLIAMATHGHGFIADVIYGTTADKVRHQVDMPVLMLKAKPKPS